MVMNPTLRSATFTCWPGHKFSDGSHEKTVECNHDNGWNYSIGHCGGNISNFVKFVEQAQYGGLPMLCTHIVQCTHYINMRRTLRYRLNGNYCNGFHDKIYRDKIYRTKYIRQNILGQNISCQDILGQNIPRQKISRIEHF